MSDTLNSRQIGEAIELIRKLAPKYNAVIDKANAAVLRIEEFLNVECSVGLPVSVNFQSPGGICVVLWYARIAGKYRIGLDVGEGPIPWPECRGRHKLKAYGHLPELLMKIANAVETAIGVAEEGEAWRCSLISALDCPIGGGA